MAHRRGVWSAALTLPGQSCLKSSLIVELAEYLDQPVQQVEARCRSAVAELADSWRKARPISDEGIHQFYRQASGYLYDLTWWHALGADESSLVQVEALEIAIACGASTALDFGSGIGSLGLLLAQQGIDVTLADINPALNNYAQWRFDRRGIPVEILNPDVTPLPSNAFDFISAVDVFEHLEDPRATLGTLAAALRLGGTLYIHFPTEPDPRYPMHLWHEHSILLGFSSAVGLSLQQSTNSTLIFRRGEGARYALRSGTELHPDGSSGVALTKHPLAAMRLNSPAFAVLTHLDRPRTAAEVVDRMPHLSLADVASFLEAMARRRLLTFQPPSMNDWPSVAIIVPAYGRPGRTRACVESLLALDYPEDRLDITVVDDASDPPLGPALQGLPVRLVRRGGNIGQSAARNLGATQASGSLLAFVDNDCEVRRGWLRSLVPYFVDQSVGLVGGRVVSPPTSGWVSEFEAVCSPLDIGGTGGEVEFLPSCNLIVRRELFFALGGFDEGMRVGEDVDFSLRLVQLGQRVVHVPVGQVIHYHRTRWKAFLRRRIDYGSTEPDIQHRHPSARRTMVLPAVGIGALAALTTWRASRILGSTLMALGACCIVGEFGIKSRRLRQLGLDLSATRIARAIVHEHLAELYHLSASATRYYGVPLLIAGLLRPRLRPIAALLLLVSPVTNYCRLEPHLPLPVFVGVYWLESAAYQIGIWRGCLERRTLQPFLPILRLGR